ncbi:MAG TPA: AGE family epimerase/isomerase, partial [Caulobacteraceae bacterium]
MTAPAKAPPAGLVSTLEALKTWLVQDAYPVWAAAGPDAELGGWHDRLDQTGAPIPGDQRARVQARQAWTFAQAPALGWAGDWRTPMLWG